jgi:hypothetical protein
MAEASAAAGNDNTVASQIGAASRAARHQSAPMVFPQPVMILWIACQASLPDATSYENLASYEI